MRGWAVAVTATVVWAVVVGVAMPRGPLTVVEALVSVGVSLVVGAAAGRASGSRWSIVLAPALVAVGVEITRLGAVGPTVDAPHASTFGAFALVAGRGVHGLLALLPMAVGAAYGAGLARRAGRVVGRRGRVGRVLGRLVAATSAAVVVLLVVLVALPATTAPIPGPRSVAELTTVPHGAQRLGLMIRGVDTSAPVVLFVPGAPGAAERGAVRAHLAALEQHAVVATLDRRGGGASYSALEPAATMGLDDETDAVVATAQYLRARFHTDRIVLLAHSGGTQPAVLAAARHPELFRAYVGVGQAVDTAEADRGEYAAERAWAAVHGDAELAAALDAAGPPPYAHVYDAEPMLLAEGPVFGQVGQGGIDESIDADEYTALDVVHLFSGLVDAQDVYYPRVQGVDLRRLVPRLDVPVTLVDGTNEVPARLPLAQQWFDGLAAPRKEHVLVPGAGHRSMFERPDEFTAVMTRVLTST